MLLKSSHRLLFPLILGVLVALAGCETGGSPYGSTGAGTGNYSNNGAAPDPRLANNNDAKFFSKSGWQACAGGAMVGIAACALSNSGNKAACAAAAGIAACGVGMGANYYLDNQRSKYASKEERLNASIADVRADNQRLQGLTSTAQSVINDDRQTLVKLQGDIVANRMDQAAAKRELAGIDANIASLRKTLSDLEKRQTQWQDVASTQRNEGANTTELDREINQMQTRVASLRSELDELYQQRSAIHVS